MTRHILPLFQISVILIKGLAALFGKWISIMNKVLIPLKFRVRLNRFALGESLNARIAVGTE